MREFFGLLFILQYLVRLVDLHHDRLLDTVKEMRATM